MVAAGRPGEPPSVERLSFPSPQQPKDTNKMRTPATSRERTFLRAELEAMLDVIAEEREALKPLLQRCDRPPPPSAIAFHQVLMRMSRETREMLLFAMVDAESATQH